VESEGKEEDLLFVGLDVTNLAAPRALSGCGTCSLHPVSDACTRCTRDGRNVVKTLGFLATLAAFNVTG
jgi:hypothetical protein